MSKPNHNFNTHQLRVWEEHEIERKEYLISVIYASISNSLTNLNRAWVFKRVQTPLLLPRELLSAEYTNDDIWSSNNGYVLRAETTAGSYIMAKDYMNGFRPPLCVWQNGFSFRKETNDGASASKMRYLQFEQLEFQCIYDKSTKADYRAAVIGGLLCDLKSVLYVNSIGTEISDRLPSYSDSTIDLMATAYNGSIFEIASISLRNDFSENCTVLEVAFGLDRLIDIEYKV